MGISIQDIIGGGTLGAVNSIIKDFKGDPNAKAQLQELVEQNTAQFKLADLEAQSKLDDIAGENIRAEAQSQSWIARNARPWFLFMGTNLICVNYVIPLLSQFLPHAIQPMNLPDWFYRCFTAGFLGYVGGRTYEKIKNADQ